MGIALGRELKNPAILVTGSETGSGVSKRVSKHCGVITPRSDGQHEVCDSSDFVEAGL